MREFKYYPEDFGQLEVEVLHMDLDFDMYEDHTVVISKLRFKVLEQITHLDLNAKNLEIVEVSERYEYLQDQDILRISFAKPLLPGTEHYVTTRTITRPTSHILEGLYYDETPKGAPCTQITQCQQWGFQRIVPCIDDMTAKCTYSTSIRADKSYTNYLTNGDVVQDIQDLGEGRVKIIYDNKVTPMATYLFFLGVGTYATFTREFEYPDGDKFMLELLVPPDSDPKKAYLALQVLHDAIMWVYLFTGEDKYENLESAKKLQTLVDERETLKKQGADFTKLQAKISKLQQGKKWGYKYTGTVYREIGMQNSDFGGMENVGNTTITTNRIMPFQDMTDGSFEYMIAVKVHEFYHNLNGSEVTGRSPFEIWLNEAVTVFMEKEYACFLFGEDYVRLDTALTLMAPTVGTFASDKHVASLPIEPDGFNDCNELITGVTYVKAPELVRMIETILGQKNFVKALAKYHAKYKHSNASRKDWIDCMQEFSEVDLDKMAHNWLKQASYPEVKIGEELYDAQQKTFTIKATQSGFAKGLAWHFPFKIALCDEQGNKLQEKQFYVKSESLELVFEGVEREPYYVAYNLGFSFFGQVEQDLNYEQLLVIARREKDVCVRYKAMYGLFDKLKTHILKGGDCGDFKDLLDLYMRFLADEKLVMELGVSLLTNFEIVADPEFAHAYDLLFNTNKKIRGYLAQNYKKQLLELYKKYANFEVSDLPYVQKEGVMIKLRSAKNKCLAILAELDNQEIWDLIHKQLQSANKASDRVTAFHLYLNTHAPDKKQIVNEYQAYAQKNLVAWETFLSVVARNNSEDHLEIIRQVEALEHFRIDQANDQRALIVGFAHNKKNSLLKPMGREFLKEKIIQLAQINEYSTGRLLQVFGALDSLKDEDQAELVKILVDLLEALDQKKHPSVYNTVTRILKGSPRSKMAYEKKYL